MSILADRVARVQISDPKPGHCSGCYGSAGPEVTFVNFDAAINRGAIVEEGSGAVLDSIDELHLCDSCVREAAETLDYKPGLHARHLQLNRQLMAERDRLETKNQTLRKLVGGDR